MKKIVSLTLAVIMCLFIMPTGISAASSDYSKMTANEFVKEITIGWNLGNTLDATDGNGMSSETSWENPKTTKAMIKAVKNAGFNTVRIPVSWGNHLDSKGKIDKKWLDRVQEVVDYAYSQDMYVIINSHHDRSWIKLDEKSEKSVTDKFTYMWKQIAARFKNYDERLIFEAMNEPRTENTENEWLGGTKSERAVLNRIYAKFVSDIRASGGYNKTRFLMLTPYAASAVYTSMADLDIPDDDKIIVSVHAYLPSDVALDTYSDSQTLTADGKKEINGKLSLINKAYTSKGIPVIMGEFGTLNKSNTNERVKIAKYYLSVAKKYGIPCCWWDNGSIAYEEGKEGFALLNRKTLEWYYPDIVEALTGKSIEKSEKITAETVQIGDKSYKTNMKGTLNLTNKNLTDNDIKNLKYMKNVTEIILSNNQLTDLSPLSGLTQLEKLTFHDNNVSDISFAKKLTKLKVFGAGNNGIKDISALSGHSELEELWLYGNNISNISALKGCKKIKKVDLSNNRITDLTPLCNSTGIIDLKASNNKLNGNLKVIKGLTISGTLYVDGNGYSEDTLTQYINENLYSDDDGFTFYF